MNGNGSCGAGVDTYHQSSCGGRSGPDIIYARSGTNGVAADVADIKIARRHIDTANDTISGGGSAAGIQCNIGNGIALYAVYGSGSACGYVNAHEAGGNGAGHGVGCTSGACCIAANKIAGDGIAAAAGDNDAIMCISSGVRAGGGLVKAVAGDAPATITGVDVHTVAGAAGIEVVKYSIV